MIVVATEFGRTARINGTEGTDHGTGTVALLAGGAVKGGRVISDWPGLKPANLYQGRDLAPTTDLRAVIKGVLQDHLGHRRARAGGRGVSRQRAGQGDEGVGGVGFSTSPRLLRERSPRCLRDPGEGKAVRGRNERPSRSQDGCASIKRMRKQFSGIAFATDRSMDTSSLRQVPDARLHLRFCLPRETSDHRSGWRAAQWIGRRRNSRDRRLTEEGYRVLRFWNNDVAWQYRGRL